MEINVKLCLNNAEYSLPYKGTMVYVWYSEELFMWEGRFLDDEVGYPHGALDGKRVVNDQEDFLYWSDVKFWIPSDEFRNKIKECIDGN